MIKTNLKSKFMFFIGFYLTQQVKPKSILINIKMDDNVYTRQRKWPPSISILIISHLRSENHKLHVVLVQPDRLQWTV